MRKFLDWLIARGKERSTILTVLTLVVGGFGLQVSPEQQEAIIGVIISVLTAIGMFTKEVK